MRRASRAADPACCTERFPTFCRTSDGQIVPTHSVSAGLDYPSVGPEHATLHDTGRVEYTSISDAEALDAFHELSHLEGIIPALESSHAIAQAKKLKLPAGQIVLVNLSGRGDKDVNEVMRIAGKRIERMTRIENSFARLKAEKPKSVYSLHHRRRPEFKRHASNLFLALEKAGADIIELGVPFSDPIADGPVIQRSDRAGAATRASV